MIGSRRKKWRKRSNAPRAAREVTRCRLVRRELRSRKRAARKVFKINPNRRHQLPQVKTGQPWRFKTAGLTKFSQIGKIVCQTSNRGAAPNAAPVEIERRFEQAQCDEATIA